MLLEKQPFADVGQVICSFGVAEYTPGSSVDGLIKKLTAVSTTPKLPAVTAWKPVRRQRPKAC